MKNIVISGYYGFNNLGDEAILAAIISLLKKLNNNLKITVLSASAAETAELYDVKAVNRNSILEIFSVLAEADLFISGGGSLLQDITGSFSAPYYLGLAWLAKIQGTKTVYYAQGAGPLNKKWSQKLTALTLNRFNFLGVRDKSSKNLLEKIGVKKDIELTVDPVFALYDSLANEPKKIKGEIEVGISVRPWSTDYLEELASGLNQFSQNKNIKFILFTMHQGADEKITNELAEKLKAPTKISTLPKSPEAALNYFSQLDLFVGVRLHSLIFALLNQVPLLALSYDPKIEALMSELDYLPLIKLENLESEKVLKELEDIFSKKNSIPKKIAGFLQQKNSEAEDFAKLVLEEVDSCES